MPQNNSSTGKMGNRHALKHGLAASIRREAEFAELVDSLAALLAGNGAKWSKTYKSTRLAEAIAAIHRLGAVEVATIEAAAADQRASTPAEQIASARQQLVKLDRYKQAAFVKYVRAFRAYLVELEHEQFNT